MLPQVATDEKKIRQLCHILLSLWLLDLTAISKFDSKSIPAEDHSHFHTKLGGKEDKATSHAYAEAQRLRLEEVE
jgi:hypothetical protein